MGKPDDEEGREIMRRALAGELKIEYGGREQEMAFIIAQLERTEDEEERECLRERLAFCEAHTDEELRAQILRDVREAFEDEEADPQ